MVKWKEVDRQLNYAKKEIENARRHIRKDGLSQGANWHLIGDSLIIAQRYLDNADRMAKGKKRKY